MWHANYKKNSTITCKPTIEEKNIIEGKSVFQAAEEIVTGNETTNIKENDLTLFNIMKNGTPCNKQKPKLVVKDIMSLTKATTRSCIDIVAKVKSPRNKPCITVVKD